MKKKRKGNRNYQAGYRVENKTANHLKNRWKFDIGQRTAGSHSPIDVIGFHRVARQIFVGQCKKHKGLIDKENTKKLKELAGTWEVVPFDIWGDRKEKNGLHFERIQI